MNTKDILGLNKLDNPNGLGYKHVLLSGPIDDEYVRIKLGTPGITLAHSDEDIRKGVQFITLFPSYKAGAGRSICRINRSILIERNIEDFISMHNVIEVGDDIDERIINDGIITAQEYGPVSFTMSVEAGKKLATNIHKWLLYRFKHNSMYGYDIHIEEYKNVIPTLSIFDITHCIPIFNTNKVNGVGVIYEGIVPGNNGSISKHRLFYLLLILSKYRENLCYVDGVHVNTQEWDRDIPESILETLKIWSCSYGGKVKEESKNECCSMITRGSADEYFLSAGVSDWAYTSN